MKIEIATLFPEMFCTLNHSIIGKAQDKGLLSINTINIRDFSQDKHKKCDDYPFGGGAGMVMTPQPIYDTINHIDPEHKFLRIYMSPKGKTLNQQLVQNLAQEKHLLFLCGNYEGVDQRIIDSQIDMEISVGDYVLTGGELPAMVVINAIARYVDGVLGSEQSVEQESFSNNLLEYPQYTRPQVFMGQAVPDVLLSGNHQNIQKWRNQKQLEITAKLRPDLLKKGE